MCDWFGHKLKYTTVAASCEAGGYTRIECKRRKCGYKTVTYTARLLCTAMHCHTGTGTLDRARDTNQSR